MKPQTDIHILPVGDTYPHEKTQWCMCQPKLVWENGTLIIIHNSWDGRELMEQQEGGEQ